VKAGKRGGLRESHEPLLDITLFDDGAVETFAKWNCTFGRTDWGMDNNGPDPTNPPAFEEGLGDCGFAGVDHGAVAALGLQPGQFFTKWFPSLVAAYFAYGVAQGEVGQPPAQPDQPDQGVDNKTLLGWLYKLGIIKGYAEVPLKLVDHYGPQFFGLLIGQRLDDDCEQLFEADPKIAWGSQNESPDPQEGHDTWLIAGDGQGGGLEVTWGGLQPFVKEYRERNWTDAWAIWFTGEPPAALQKALHALHGVGETETPETATEGLITRFENDGVELLKILHKALGMALERVATRLIVQFLTDELKRL